MDNYSKPNSYLLFEKEISSTMCEFRLKEICVQVKYFKTFADKVNLVSKHVSTFLGFVSESNNFDLKNMWWDRKTCV